MENRKDETGLRPLAHVAGALVVWVATMVIATRTLTSGPHSALVRGAMVALGVGGFLPWLIAIARLIMTQDEFIQRIHLVAVALACAGTAVLVLAGDYLQTAGFIGYVPLQGIWLAMGVPWWLGILIATRYYR